MYPWFRLWNDFSTDPKWRVIAEKSGQPLAVVIATAVHLMSDASQNEESRGVTTCHTDVTAVTIGVTKCHVEAVTCAMQGIVLDGNKFINWEKRQPKREREVKQGCTAKTAAERKREERARKRGVTNVTPCHAKNNLDTESDKDKDYNIHRQSINHTKQSEEKMIDLTDVLIEDSLKIEVKEKGKPETAPPLNANQLIQQADQLIAKIFDPNHCRPTLHATDQKTVQSWIDAGITETECLDAIRRVCDVLNTKDLPVPRALSYFNNAVFAIKGRQEKPAALVGEIESLQPWVMELVREGLVEYSWAQSWLERCKLEGSNRIVCPSPFVASWLTGSGNHVIAAIEKRKRINYRIEVAA